VATIPGNFTVRDFTGPTREPVLDTPNITTPVGGKVGMGIKKVTSIRFIIYLSSSVFICSSLVNIMCYA